MAQRMNLNMEVPPLSLFFIIALRLLFLQLKNDRLLWQIKKTTRVESSFFVGIILCFLGT